MGTSGRGKGTILRLISRLYDYNGERQRIFIARALLKNAPILLLDEISASLDVENEWKIQEALNRLIRSW